MSYTTKPAGQTLIQRLEAMARSGHDDLSVADEAAAEIERLTELVRWAYTKLHDGRMCIDMDDALKLDEMKLLLEHGR